MYHDTTDADISCSVILREAIDNALDEANSGFGKSILVTTATSTEEYNIIVDHARGVPLTFNTKENQVSAHLIFNTLHSSSKFDDKISGQVGTHGVGVSCTNALSF